MNITIEQMIPTLFFTRQTNGTLQQRIDITIQNDCKAHLLDMQAISKNCEMWFPLEVPAGSSLHSIYLPQTMEVCELTCLLKLNGDSLDQKTITWRPQRLWEVYLVHGSHHDLGYTDLPSNVIREQYGFMDMVLDFCDQSDDFPPDAQFHYVAEQAWSVLHYLEHCPPQQALRLLERLRSGRIEVTALLDNETSELCGHEEQIRLVYPAFRLKRRFGIPIETAELNDIPGISWGLVKVLAGCGVRYFAPAIQDYFAWGMRVHPFWDEEAILGRNQIGAFWWQGPSDEKVLFWYGGGLIDNLDLWNTDQAQLDLAALLEQQAEGGYPFEKIRLKFHGARRDNSPPDIRLSLIVKEWNQRWAYPHLTITTNAQFFKEFEQHHGNDLRTFRGDFPNTDYPIGATSRAKELGINRLTHDTVFSAEKFATIAALVSDYQYPANTLSEAIDCMLLHDGHTGGMFHPIGPAQEASWAQKAEFSYRAAALAHDVLLKSTNRLGDYIHLDDDAYYIVVFNSLSFERTDLVNVPGVELSPANRPTYWRDAAPDKIPHRIQGSRSLIGRNLVNLPLSSFTEGTEVLDVSTGERSPCQVLALTGPDAAKPYAAQRWALGNNDANSIEELNLSKGHHFELQFVANKVPSLGYKLYQVVPLRKQSALSGSLRSGENWIENRFFRIELDSPTGTISRLFDKTRQREWVDPTAPHGFNGILVRSARGDEIVNQHQCQIKVGDMGPISASLVITSSLPGIPHITQEITLYEELERIDLSHRVLKDATPLQEVYIAFPFLIEKPEFVFETSNAVFHPVEDQLPGTNTDAYTIQHWVQVSDADNPSQKIVWSSREAPIIVLGELWPGYVSQAHHGITPAGYGHEFLRDSSLFPKGHIYSYLMNNNFRTNFETSQVADMIFRYSIEFNEENHEDNRTWQFGWSVNHPLQVICLNGPQTGSLPAEMSFCQVYPNSTQLMALKAAEDGEGIIVRIAEMQGNATEVRLSLPLVDINQAFRASLAEEKLAVLPYTKHTVFISMKPYSTETIYIKTKQKMPTVDWLESFS